MPSHKRKMLSMRGFLLIQASVAFLWHHFGRDWAPTSSPSFVLTDWTHFVGMIYTQSIR